VRQAAPRRFKGEEVGVVQDLVDLVRELVVDRGDDRLDRLDRVIGNQVHALQRLSRQRLDGLLDGLLGVGRLGLELLLEERLEIAATLYGKTAQTR
jgi:hypothetical protein